MRIHKNNGNGEGYTEVQIEEFQLVLSLIFILALLEIELPTFGFIHQLYTSIRPFQKDCTTDMTTKTTAIPRIVENAPYPMGARMKLSIHMYS
jgi:hypothetical protein